MTPSLESTAPMSRFLANLISDSDPRDSDHPHTGEREGTDGEEGEGEGEERVFQSSSV